MSPAKRPAAIPSARIAIGTAAAELAADVEVEVEVGVAVLGVVVVVGGMVEIEVGLELVVVLISLELDVNVPAPVPTPVLRLVLRLVPTLVLRSVFIDLKLKNRYIRFGVRMEAYAYDVGVMVGELRESEVVIPCGVAETKNTKKSRVMRTDNMVDFIMV